MQQFYRWGLLGVLVAAGLGVMVVLWLQRTPEAVATADVHVTAFLAQHWRLPIPPQGEPPTQYSPLEASLHPKECGLCHPQQYQDWQTSIHRTAMSAGIYGQLLDMEQSDPGTYIICANCHTPLSEQMPHRLQNGRYEPNADFDPNLQQAGLVCAACHVRQHQRFGPPRRPELPPHTPDTVLPHGGFTETVAFGRSEFCKSCHQFGPDDFALNGKLIENTYAEWKESPYAAAGVQCQNCHMPDRRHLWRGIHDPDMVKQAMTVAIKPNASSYKPGDTVQAVITVTNSGAGHYLPTYVTPKIFVDAHMLNAQGQRLAASAQQAIIGREVTLNLSAERYDTRIPPKGSRAVTYEHVLPTDAVTLHVRITVHPDHFYRGFFEAVLQHGGGGKGRAHLQEALRDAEASPFTVFERDISLQ